MTEPPSPTADAPTPASTPAPVHHLLDPREVAYWERRKVVRRRTFAAAALVATLTLGLAAWLFLSHLMTSFWLEANHYVVLWSVDRDNWKQGGSTSVRYSAGRYLFTNETPPGELRLLGRLYGLEELDLSTLPKVVDADLAGLGDHATLRRLNLDRSLHPEWVKPGEKGLTDATLARIGRLKRLVDLNLGGHRGVTDAGLESLAGLDRLQSLDLNETGITDAGLARLEALPALKSLNIRGTKVTPGAVYAFETARPGVVVLSDVPPNTFGFKAPR